MAAEYPKWLHSAPTIVHQIRDNNRTAFNASRVLGAYVFSISGRGEFLRREGVRLCLSQSRNSPLRDRWLPLGWDSSAARVAKLRARWGRWRAAWRPLRARSGAARKKGPRASVWGPPENEKTSIFCKFWIFEIHKNFFISVFKFSDTPLYCFLKQ